MKKALSLLLAVLMVLALFAGCGGNGTQQGGSTPPAQTDGNGGSSTADPVAESSPYNYPVGKYEKNEEGYPTAKYHYDAPICSNDEVLTKWSTCYTPQYIPEDGWMGIPTWKGVRDYTGVHIEYTMVDSANRSQNFSVLLASDSLLNIMDQANYFYTGGTLLNAVEDGYFVNLYDYRDYMPNYMREVYLRSRNNREVLDSVYYDPQTMITLYGMIVEPAPSMGYFVRQDWMDKLGLGQASDIRTYDQLHTMLLAAKAAYSTPEKEIFPFFINDVVEVSPGAFFGGYNTAVYTSRMSYQRVKDGKVEFCGTTEDDRQAMTLLSTWYQEGLISPNYQSYVAGGDYDAGESTNGLFCHLMTPSSWDKVEDSGIDPDTHWEPTVRLKQTEDQILQYGNKQSNFHLGTTIVTGTCPNVELAVTWLDWWMSDFGSDYTSWGPEGYLWEYNEQGERRLTDWCLHNEAGMDWIMCLYGCNALSEFCLLIHKRNYAYEGGARALTAFDVLTVQDYGGEYDWPASVKFDDDEREEIASLSADMNTYFQETYAGFVDGSRPMSQWDAYIDGLNSFGYGRMQEIYQAAYDRYTAA